MAVRAEDRSCPCGRALSKRHRRHRACLGLFVPPRAPVPSPKRRLLYRPRSPTHPSPTSLGGTGGLLVPNPYTLRIQPYRLQLTIATCCAGAARGGGPRRFGARMASQRERGKQFRRTHYQKDAKLERIEPREAHRFAEANKFSMFSRIM